MFGPYQISEIEYGNGDIKYVLERFVDGEWKSVFRSKDLEEIRQAKREREATTDRDIASKKVIE